MMPVTEVGMYLEEVSAACLPHGMLHFCRTAAATVEEKFDTV